jgi:hypothetical protein
VSLASSESALGGAATTTSTEGEIEIGPGDGDFKEGAFCAG